MKKRIVVVAEYFPPRLGGDRRIFELMKRLSKKYDTHFITLPPSYILFIRKIDSYNTSKNPVLCGGMIGHRIHLPRFIWQLWTKAFLLPFSITMIYLLIETAKKIAQLKPDIIVIDHTSAYTGLLGFVCSKILNKKLLVDYNDLMSLYTCDLLENKVDKFSLRALKPVLVVLEDIMVKYGLKVTTVTSFLKDYASIRNVRKDIVLIPNGVDTNLFDPGQFRGGEIRSKYAISDTTTLCVYTGRIDECAGAKMICKIAKLMNEEDVKFMIVGEGDRRMVTKLSTCDNVILTGLMPKEEVPVYLAAADIVLIPFPNTLASHAISPLKLFEALAMEKSVIASAVSGVKDVIVDNFNGILVSCDPKQWVMAIKWLIEDPKKLKIMGRNGRHTVGKRFDWDRLAEMFCKVIEE